MLLTLKKSFKIIRSIILQLISLIFIKLNKNRFKISQYKNKSYFDILICSDFKLLDNQIKKIKSSDFKSKYIFRLWIVNFSDTYLIKKLLKEIKVSEVFLCIEDYTLLRKRVEYNNFIKDFTSCFRNEMKITLIMPLDMKFYSLLNKEYYKVFNEIRNLVNIKYIHYIRYFFRRLKRKKYYSLNKNKGYFYYHSVQNLVHQIFSSLESKYTTLGASFFNVNNSRALRKSIKNKYLYKSENMYRELLYKTIGYTPLRIEQIRSNYPFLDIRHFYIRDYYIKPKKQLFLSKKIIENSNAKYIPFEELL